MPKTLEMKVAPSGLLDVVGGRRLEMTESSGRASPRMPEKEEESVSFTTFVAAAEWGARF